MSYQYDPETRRYVLNTQHMVSSPANREKLSVSLDTPKSTKSPLIIRVTSKTKMISNEGPNQKNEAGSAGDRSEESELSKRQQPVSLNNSAVHLKSQENKLGKNGAQGQNSSKPMTALPVTDLGRSEVSEASGDNYFGSSNMNIMNKRAATDRHSNPIERLPNSFAREPVRSNGSFITPRKSMEEAPRASLETATAQKQPMHSSALKEMSKMLTAQIEEKFRQEDDDSHSRDRKVMTLQQTNMDMKVENAALQNEISSLRAKFHMVEESNKSQLESLKCQVSLMQGTINNFEIMRNEISGRLGERKALSVQEIVNRMEIHLSQKQRLEEKIKTMETEIKVLRDNTASDKKVIDQLRKFNEDINQRQRDSLSADRNRSYSLEKERDEVKEQLRRAKEEVHHSSNHFQGVLEADRKQISDLTKQVEDYKQQLKKAKQQLTNRTLELSNAKQFKDLVDADKRQMADLVRQLEDNKQELKKTKDQLAQTSALLTNAQQLQEVVQANKRQIADLTKQLEDHRHQLRRTKDELSNASAQLSNVQQLKDIIDNNKRQITDLTKQLGEERQQHKKAKDELAMSSSQLSNVQRLKDTIEADKQQIAEMSKQLDQQKQQLKKAKDELTSTSSQLNNAQQFKDIVQSNRKQMSDLTRQLEDQKQQLRRAKDQIANNNKIHEQTKRNINKATQKLSSMQFDLKSAQNMAQIERQQKNKLVSQVSNTFKQVNDLQRNIHTLDSQIRTLKSAKTQLQQKLSITQRNNSTLTDRLSSADSQLSQKTRSINKLHQNLENTQKQFRQASEDLKIMREDFNSITYLHTTKQKQLIELINKSNIIEAKSQEKVTSLQREIESMKAKIEEKNNQHKQEQDFWHDEIGKLMKLLEEQYERIPHKNAAFEEILRTQVQEIQSLKRKLTEKEEVLFQLRQKLSDSQSAIDAAKSELEFQKLRTLTEKKAMRNSHEQELQNVNNELEKSQRMVDSLSVKIKHLMDETKSKDTFIQKNLMGRAASPEEQISIQEFFKEFQSVVNLKEPKEQVAKEYQRISELQFSNRMLARELKKLKERR